ncbi:MAG: YidB family protein [bacterium]
MGFFDFLKGASKKAGTAASGAAPGGGAVTAGSAEESAVSGLLGEGGGQLSGLLDKFGAGGLGDTVKSWVGTGANQPVSGEQVSGVLGSDAVSSVAGKLGVSDSEAASKIATVLPQIIDKLTPDGLVPDPAALANKLTGFMKK